MFYSFIDSLISYGRLEIVDKNNKLRVFGKSNPTCRIKIHNNSIKSKLFLNPDLYLGEGYVNEDFTIEQGKLEDLIEIITKNYNNINKDFYHQIINFFSSKIRIIQQLNSTFISKKNVAHHYDINDDFYKLFLDDDMQYSCGYFHNENISLEQAQLDKKNHLIKKLNIDNKNIKVLDVGCGWGGMAIQIAKNTGAKVKGITLSKNQYETAIKRIKNQNLENLIDIELTDYRNVKGKFDRIISVGMFEHVGLGHYRKFFNKMKNLLTDNGLMVLHSIGQKSRPSETNAWIRKYIFPGGYIPSVSEVMKNIEKEDLWVADTEIWRLHYANTLKHWRRNFNINRNQIIEIMDEKFCRMWEFYLVTSEYSFRNMGNMVFQMQIAKNQSTVPLTRNYLYL